MNKRVSNNDLRNSNETTSFKTAGHSFKLNINQAKTERHRF
jgi:hypothetical protein